MLSVVVLAAVVAGSGCVRGVRIVKKRIEQREIRASQDLQDDPQWGCGIYPGINADASTQSEIERLIDGISVSSSFKQVTTWSQTLTPRQGQYLKGFNFMPQLFSFGIS